MALLPLLINGVLVAIDDEASAIGLNK